VLALVALLAILVGRGVGLFGNEPRADGAADARAAAEASPAAAPAGESAAPAAAVPTASSRSQASPEGPASAGADRAAGAAAAPPVPVDAGAADSNATRGDGTDGPRARGEPAFDADRFASLLASLRAAIGQDRLGEALATVRHARTLPLDGAQQAALLVAAQELEQALAAACARIVQQLAAGHVLAAHGAVAELLAADDPATASVLQEALRAVGVRAVLRAELPSLDPAWPTGRPLPRGRAVRVAAGGRVAEGTVVDGRADQVTVRVAGGGGFTFPTVAALAAEPVQPTADEAVELGLLALHGRQGLLARLWLAVARLQSPGGLPARGARLAEILEP
jgi:hypothetical protein